MQINLVSDTVTKPSFEMLQYMFNAAVGDDVYRQDPTVVELEETVAAIFGMEAALFFPSGTMANQTAIKVHTQPGEQLIAEKNAHIFLYESGGVGFNSGVNCCLVEGHRGMITAHQVAAAITNPDHYYTPLTTLVCVENTTNVGGGACYDIEELRRIKEVCLENNLKFHMDGARIWNALIAKRQDPKDFGKLFDTISVCFSKGLGAPVGSVLVGDRESIQKALRIRKVLGGGMRQVGYLAAAGIYALENNISRLAEDHKRARELAEVLSQLNCVDRVEDVETNIVVFSLKPEFSDTAFVEKLKQKNISISAIGKGKLRIVTHLDYREVMHTYVLETLSKL